ncbi:MAG: hypothetical protein HY810_08565 [Candidatus Omnitrophica bacterium]|nr:hypothetical protein [Candidatus Omnitrophota bacterium]
MDFNLAAWLANKVIRQPENLMDAATHARAHCLYAGAKGMIAYYGGPVSKIVNGSWIFPHLKAARQLQENNAAVLLGLGSYYLLIPPVLGQDIERAREYLELALEKDPFCVNAYVRLAQAYRLKGDEVKYKEYLDKASKIDPGDEILIDIKNGTGKFIYFDALK